MSSLNKAKHVVHCLAGVAIVLGSGALGLCDKASTLAKDPNLVHTPVILFAFGALVMLSGWIAYEGE